LRAIFKNELTRPQVILDVKVYK